MQAAEVVRDEMREHVRNVVALSTESRKTALYFAAKVLGLPVCRVEAMFYRKARTIHAHEADQIRAYVEAAHNLIEKRAEYERQRAAFVGEAHLSLVRLAPAPLVGTEVSEAASKEAVTEAATVKRGRS